MKMELTQGSETSANYNYKLTPGKYPKEHIQLQYNSLLNLRCTNHTFADDLVIMIKADSIREAENIANVEMSEVSAWSKEKIRLMNKNQR
jgi:hypothetical protein